MMKKLIDSWLFVALAFFALFVGYILHIFLRIVFVPDKTIISLDDWIVGLFIVFMFVAIRKAVK